MKNRKNPNLVFVETVMLLSLLWLITMAADGVPLQAQPCPSARALWVYQCQYDPILDPNERDNVFFPFVRDHEITEVFLTVHFNCSSGQECRVCPSGDQACRQEGPSYRAALRLFLRKAHHRGIRVHALYGRPEFALTANHRQVLARVQALLDFQDRSEADQRFDGIHLDVEPHGLPQYRCPDGRCTEAHWAIRRDLLRQFLDMNAAVVAALDGQGLRYGVDIPFSWHPYFDERGVFQARRNIRLNYNGREDYPTYHLMDMVKEIAIMAYHRDPRTTIRWTEFAIDHAAQPEVGACVSVGVQTSLPGRDQCSPFNRTCRETFACSTQGPCAGFGCETATGQCLPCGQNFMEQELSTIDREFSGYDSFQGFAFFKYGSYRDMPR